MTGEAPGPDDLTAKHLMDADAADADGIATAAWLQGLLNWNLYQAL